MDSMENSTNSRKDLSLNNADVVYGHKICYSNAAKWLGISNIYEKFHRPNHYDIGGTYIDTVPDYWISFKTERVGNIFLLHVFMYRRDECSFRVGISFGNEMYVLKTCDSVHLPLSLKECNIVHVQSEKQNNFVYITTYSFDNLDVEVLKDKNLFIAVSFLKSDSLNLSLLNKMKAKHHYGALLTDPVGSDFTMESSDGETFKVHKNILSAYSEVFKAMFKEETAESRNNYVKLIDVNGEDLKYMLEFIYTGTIKDMDNVDFSKLLILSDLYNLKGLWRMSQNALAQQLAVSNALYTLAIAHMYDAEFLKLAVFKFIKRNSDALKTDNFKEITDVDLMRQLCEYLAHQE